jgi:hypothetical protein
VAQCSLCDQERETTELLCLHCPYAREVCQLVATWSGNLVTVPRSDGGVEKWWNAELLGLPRQPRRVKAAIMMYTTWNIRKERIWCVFEGRSVHPPQVFRFIKDEMALRVKATESGVPLSSLD